jgi:hypothetical protein
MVAGIRTALTSFLENVPLSERQRFGRAELNLARRLFKIMVALEVQKSPEPFLVTASKQIHSLANTRRSEQA